MSTEAQEAFRTRFDAEMRALLQEGLEVNAAAAEALRRATDAVAAKPTDRETSAPQLKGDRDGEAEMDLEPSEGAAATVEPEEPPQPVDLRQLEQQIEVFDRDNRFEPLYEVISYILRTSNVLSCSFIREGEAGGIAVDNDAALLFWKLLGQIEDRSQELKELIHRGLESLGLTLALSDPTANVSGLQPGAWHRQHAILLLYPKLADPDKNQVLKGLCAGLSKLSADQALDLSSWMAQLSPDLFEAITLMVQQHLTLTWLLEPEVPDLSPGFPGAEPQKNVKSVLNAVRVLSMLFTANGGCGPGSLADDIFHIPRLEQQEAVASRSRAAQMQAGRFLPWSAFYSDTVNNEMMGSPAILERQYQDWRRDTIYKLKRAEEQLKAAKAAKREDAPAEAKKEENAPDAKATPLFDDLGSVRSILSFPFVIEPAVKAQILSLDADLQMRHQFRQDVDYAIQATLLTGMHVPPRVDPYMHLHVGRDTIVRDTLDQVVLMPDEFFKKQLRVRFKDELGVDEGGVRKEFFQIIMRDLLHGDYDVFSTYEDSVLFFNPSTMEEAPTFELIGILLGVAIYNGIILDLPFPKFLYKKLLGGPDVELGLEDLAEIKPQVAKSMENLLAMDPSTADSLEQMWVLNYESNMFGEHQIRTIPLVEGGETRVVKSDERAEFVDRFVHWWLVESIKPAFDCFKRGFWKVCGGPILDCFRAEELELLICGNPVLDFDELEAAAKYADGYTEHSAVIRYFWCVLHGLGEDQKRAFLKFVTGSDRAPIRGLGSLELTISKNGDDSDRLPTSHTCFNHLLLPEYSSVQKVRDRLLLAIQNTEGFGLR
uniref:HECT-type E3 ubiquitin transferase n=1 Tax=Pinguiococcus pyrenoidosus TaxID=172671 RepID=A0A7R9U4A3_9STRA|mmetsp:Transcript_14503/g.54786  ORF Transcript_14503/g.54786 Transcript_14503/m.54786 type:complete len:826 (+) Transcript_14503:72-2549(+)